MKVFVEPTAIPDVILVKPEMFRDPRGFFTEVFREDVFAEAGLPTRFVQLNHSRSARDVVRGLHFQWEPPMGKLMRVTQGSAFLVAVDIRRRSPTLGQWVSATLDATDMVQMWAPAGFARGFCVLSEFAEVQYLCTGVYNANGEAGIRWNDSELNIPWPTATPVLSGKDERAPSLREWLAMPQSDYFQT
ncbi:MAG TPA: dTDP-4-dehydrorhamnose 3,5-epimerase [Gemmatimonadaceae bacterium]|nr:dTDP-4-dehydrorhamnose 3,5-epimerase [Gemmatimonadaceae bacterium]